MKATTKRFASFSGLLAVAAVAGGCASGVPAPVTERAAQPRVESAAAVPSGKDYYTVKKGDTLYSVARASGHDPKDVAAWNNLDSPGSLQIGQILRIAPPESAATAVVVKPVSAQADLEVKALGGPGAVEAAPLPATVAGGDLKREPKGGKQPYSEQALAALQKSEASPPVAAIPATPTAAAEPKADTKTDVKAPEAKAGDNDSGIDWLWPGNGKLIAQFSEPTSKGIDISGRPGEPVLAAAAGKVMYVGSGIRGYGNLIIVKHSNGYLSAYGHNRKILVKENQSVKRGQKIAELGDSDADQPKLHFEIRRQGKPTDPLKYLPPR
jgi:lipoprotein NlpD